MTKVENGPEEGHSTASDIAQFIHPLRERISKLPDDVKAYTLYAGIVVGVGIGLLAVRLGKTFVNKWIPKDWQDKESEDD